VLSFFDNRFWVVSAVAVLLVRLAPVRKGTVFGVVNVGALGLVVGWPAAGAGVGFAVLFWVVLASILAVRRKRPGSLATWISRTTLLVPLVIFLANKWALEFDPAPASHPHLRAILLPLGLSYVFLRCLDAAHAVVWKRQRLMDPLALFGYLFPFPMLLSGPVNRYDEHAKMDDGVSKGTDWLAVVNDLTTGFFYKFVAAEFIRAYWFGPRDPLHSYGWADTAVLFVYIFFDFAGYSRIVLGIGRAVGVPTPENFRAPFRAASVTEFFTRWHISLGVFVQRNIYTPLQLYLVRRWGVRRAASAGLVVLLVAWAFVGLWHRLSLGFLGYGLGMAGVVWIEKWIRDRALKRTWARSATAGALSRLLGPVYVFVVLTTMIDLIVGEIFR
jgi:D-alanyl-lipoteichoic acid acyltransferase DltB (MBOAT superfamily)